MVWVLSIEIQHLRAGAEAEAEAGDDRRALQPATAGRARDHVAVTVDRGDVHGVAPHLAAGLRTGPRPVALGDRLIRGPGQPGRAAARGTGTQPHPTAIPHDLAPP